MLPVIPFFGLEIPSYTLMLVAGFVAGILAALHRRSVYAIRTEVIIAACFLTGIGALLGGKLFYAVQGIPEFLELSRTQGTTFLEYFSRAGLVYYGGMFGAIGFLFLAGSALHEPHWALFDTVLPSLPLAQAFGRVGCFLVGCCYGIPSPAGLRMNPDGLAPAAEPLVPVQLYESAGVLVLFFVLYHLSARQQPRGRLLSVYLICYGCLRFGLEFLRGDAVRGFLGALSVSQWISLGAVSAGVFLLMRALHPERSGRPLGQSGI